jgi:hypothetical protein
MRTSGICGSILSQPSCTVKIDSLASVILNPTRRQAEMAALRMADAWKPSHPSLAM